MPRVTISTTYTLKCDKCNSTVDLIQEGIPNGNTLDSHRMPELKGWKVEKDVHFRTSNEHFTRRVSEIVCPTCIEKDRQIRMKSEDIFERSNAGYYNEQSDDSIFVQDVYDHFGISESHPKIKKFWDLVYVKDTYSEKLYYIDSIIELFK